MPSATIRRITAAAARATAAICAGVSLSFSTATPRATFTNGQRK